MPRYYPDYFVGDDFSERVRAMRKAVVDGNKARVAWWREAHRRSFLPKPKRTDGLCAATHGDAVIRGRPRPIYDLTL